MKHEEGNNRAESVVVTISPNELDVIGSVLFPYAKFVRRVIPPSREQGRTLTLVENLRQRIATRRHQEGEQFPVTVAELSVIDAALKNFVVCLQHMFPQSPERDETITACERLRQYIALSFSPRRSH